MSKRLLVLEKMVKEQNSTDPFAWYGLALEYRQLGRIEDSLATFANLRERSPDYLPMYLMAGQLLLDEGRTEAARDWLEAGLALAKTQGNAKAEGEIGEALAQC